MLRNLTTAFLLSLVLLGMPSTKAQETLNLTLPEVVSMAKSNSPASAAARHRFNSGYWQYRTFKASLMPYMSLDATLPDLNRSISRITLPDGRDAFVKRSLANYSSSISIKKPLGWTGGELFVNSGLQRIDVIGDSLSTSYLSTPLVFGIRQPLFGFNVYRWMKKIEPLRYQEAEKRSLEDMENIALEATGYFFDVLLAASDLSIAQLNEANNDTIYKITKGRYNIGTIAENDLLQMELALLNSHTEVTRASLALDVAQYKLRSYLGIKTQAPIRPIIGETLPTSKAELEIAQSEAHKNRSDAIAYQRRKIESDRDVAQAKRENRFNVNVFATYGLTQNALNTTDVYKNPQDQQQAAVGLQIPVIDWGRARAAISTAKSNRDLVYTTTEQQMSDFDQEVFLKVMQYNLQHDQLSIATKADTVAQQRYELTKQRYLIGKIDITQLNIASAEKDQARRSYLESLKSLWTLYYQLRLLTLYDFEAKKALKD